MKEVKMNFGNLYDMNKELVEKTFTPVKGKAMRNRVENIIKPFFKEKNAKYFMMLCHDVRDYTVFHVDDSFNANLPHSYEMVATCIENRGVLYAIDKTEDNNAIEIWLKSTDERMLCYYLFPYDTAIVEVVR